MVAPNTDTSPLKEQEKKRAQRTEGGEDDTNNTVGVS